METRQAGEARERYSTDVTDKQWARIEHLVPPVRSGTSRGGRPAKYSRREILNAIFYVTKTGTHWRLMPHDLPPWKSAYYYFMRWRDAGVFEQINTALRKEVRRKEGRNPEPSAVIMDSQSVKTGEKGGPSTGMDSLR